MRWSILSLKLRLTRWGCELRHASDAGWRVRVRSGTSLAASGSPSRPPQTAVEVVIAYARELPLEPMARLRTVRQRVELRDAGGETLADLTDDEVSVLDGRRLAERFRELELKLRPTAPEGLLPTCLAYLEAAGARPGETTPRLVRALGPAALAHGETDVEELADGARAGELVRRAIAASVVRFMSHDPGVAIGDDPEDVHQARVGLRRLRSDLRTFRALVDDAWADKLSGEARWLAGLLGTVRDAEVLRDRLRANADGLPDADRRVGRALTQRLEDARARARDTLLAARREPRFVALASLLVEAAQAPELTDLAQLPAADVVAPLVAKPRRRLRKAAAEATLDGSDEQLHRVRISAKRLRYAAEAAAPVAGKRAARLARAAADLQDVLGEHQDAVIAQEWLRHAAARATRRQAFVAGELCADEARAARRAQRRWHKAWKRVARPNGRVWLRRSHLVPFPAPAAIEVEEQPAADPEAAPIASDPAANGASN